MGSLVFVDTSALVGKFLEADERHDRALQALRRLLRDGRELLTSDYVFDEVVTLVRGRADHGSAVKAGEGILGSQVLDLVEVDGELRKDAWRLFRKYRDQVLSFTDCTSFAVMEKYGIREAFTFDEDFSKVGFEVVPRRKR
jgi:predicted nucleic acid-binding protein